MALRVFTKWFDCGHSTPPDLPDGSRFSHYNGQGMLVNEGIGGYQVDSMMKHAGYVAPGSAWAPPSCVA